MARIAAQFLALSTLGIALTGCVSQEKYNALKLDRDRLSEQLSQADSEARTARREAELYKGSLDQIKNSGDSKDAMLANQTQQLAEMQRLNDELRRKYDEALGMVGRSGTSLSPALTSALTDFAAQNPDLVEFDAARGMVKFKSDLTFAVGSAEVTEQAKTAIARFAQILNSSAAASHELLVAGHTDSTRVNNPATIQKGHKDNWYLSAHRALEVSSELRTSGVNAQRLGAVGYADQRPVADNGSEAGKARNRRVEVLILPTTVGGGTRPTGGNTAARPSSAAPAQPVLNKDSSMGSMNK